MKVRKIQFILIFILFFTTSKALADTSKIIVDKNGEIEVSDRLKFSVETSYENFIQLYIKVSMELHESLMKIIEDKGEIIATAEGIRSFNQSAGECCEFIILMNPHVDDELIKEEVIALDWERGEAQREAARNQKIAYLTFDDGPSANTYKILDVLREYNVKGTFFVLGKSVEANKDILKAVHDQGHAIGNHTYSHNYDYLYSNVDNFMGEIYKTEELIKSIIPDYKTKMIRFPGGSFGRTKHQKAVEKAGYKHFNWHVDSEDSKAILVPVEHIKESVFNTLWYRRIVILFHDTEVKTTTPEALPGIIEYLRKEGYKFEMLVEDSFNSF